MTRQNITHIANYIMVSIVSLCLLWLTLLDVNTGWCEEMPQLLYVMLAVNAIAFLPVLFIDKINKICWLDKIVLLWFVYITFNYWFISPYPAGERYFTFLSSLLLYILLRYTLQKTANIYCCLSCPSAVFMRLCLKGNCITDIIDSVFFCVFFLNV